MPRDAYLDDCVLHPGQRAVTVSLVDRRGVELDFCAECIDEGRNDDNFGRCYECRDGDHHRCIGVPCQCPCPTPDQRERERLRQQALAKLTPDEQRALGVL